MSRNVVLFYKRIVNTGGAELLMSRHYQYFKDLKVNVKVATFEYERNDKINLNDNDVVILRGNLLQRLWEYSRFLLALNNSIIYIHSGYIESGVVNILLRKSYNIFIHHPTSMSYNEQDKFSVRYWKKYVLFARKTPMYNKLKSIKESLSLKRKVYIEIRSIISQLVLRKAKNRFVLSKYAVKEKKEIFGLDTVCLNGALTEEEIEKSFNRPYRTRSNKSLNLLTISRIDENKRIDILINAMKFVLELYPDATLKIGGKGPSLDSLKNIVLLNKLEEHVIFLGYVADSDFESLFDETDLFVTIDWADYRITTFESLQYHVPVVVSSETEYNEYFEKSGWVFRSLPEAEALAETISKALTHEHKRNHYELSQYLHNFSWKVYFDNIGFYD